MTSAASVMMTLDLGEPDEGLLVPFKHNANEPVNVEQQPHITSPRRASLSRFFRRRRSNDDDADQRSSLLNTTNDQEYNGFHYQQEQDIPLAKTIEEEEESDEESEEGSDGSENEEDSSDDDKENADDCGGYQETETPAPASPPQQQSRTPRLWRPHNELQKQGLLENDSFANHDEHQQSLPFKLEGFGSAPPLPDPRDNRFIDSFAG